MKKFAPALLASLASSAGATRAEALARLPVEILSWFFAAGILNYPAAAVAQAQTPPRRGKNSAHRRRSCDFFPSLSLRIAAFVLAALFVFVLASPSANAETPQRNDSERELFALLNRDRASNGLAELQWDDALFKAARQHALLMLNLNILEHQLPGEPSLEERLKAAGARFSFIAENIAVGKDPSIIHAGWMISPGHRRNILDARATSVGIAVVRGTGGLYAVEDFSQSFANLSLEDQEKQVGALLSAKGLHVEGTREARNACNSDGGLPGVQAWSVVRFDIADLHALAPEVEQKIRKERYRNVAVGACRTSEAPGFSRYRIALVFY